MNVRLLSYFFVAICCVALQSTFGQISFTSTIPLSTDPLVVCGDAKPFTVTLTNNGGSTSSGGQLTITFPAGIRYKAGSIVNATELNISNLEAPIFTVPNIASAASTTLNYQAMATCERINEPVNANNFSYTSSLGGPFTATTASYNVAYGALTISSVTNQNYSGGVPAGTYSRTVTIINGGFGPVDTLFVDETNTGGLLIQSVSGATVTGASLPIGNTTFRITNFSGVGNGNNLLDNGESISFTETMLIPGSVTCGGNAGSSTTNYNAYFGCFAPGQCPITNSTDISDAEVASASWYGGSGSAATPNLIVSSPSANTSLCFGNTMHYTYTVQNTGLGDAFNAVIQTQVGGSNYSEILYAHNFTINGTPITHTVLTGVSVGSGGGCFASLPTDAAVTAGLNAGTIPAGQTITIGFDIERCANANWCMNSNFYRGFNIPTIGYQDLCGRSYGYSGSGTLGGEETYMGIAVDGKYVPAILNDEETLDVCYDQLTFKLAENDNTGYMEMIYDLHPGATLDLTYTPTIQDYSGNSWFPAPGYPQVTATQFIIRYNFATVPFQLYSGDYRRFCFRLKGVLNQGCTYQNNEGYINVYPTSSCTIPIKTMCSNTLNYAFSHFCSPPACEGANSKYFDLVRTSYGYPDTNDNNISETGETLDISKLRLHSTMIGDTVRGIFKAVINNPNNVTNWSAAGLMQYWDGSAALSMDPLALSASPKIWDASSATYLTLSVNNIVPSKKIIGTDTYFYYDITPAIPSGFHFDQGDSLILTQFLQNTRNYLWASSGIFNHPYVGPSATPAASFDYWYYPANEFGCGQMPSYLVAHPIQSSINASIETNPTGCNIGTMVISPRWDVNGSSQCLGRLFPYEVRRPFTESVLTVALPNGSDFIAARVTGYNSGCGTFAILPITPLSNAGGVVSFDMSKIYQTNGGNHTLFGESNQNIVRIDFSAPCGTSPQNNLPVIETLLGDKAVASIIPTQTLTTNYSITPGSGSDLGWVFTNFANTTVNGDTLFADIVYWAPPTSATNIFIKEFPAVNSLQLVGLSNTSFPFTYDAGLDAWIRPQGINGTSVHITAKFLYTGCLPDSIELMTGFSCTGLPTANELNNPALLCNYQKVKYKVARPNTQLQQIITVDAASSNPHQLCDTVDYQIAVSSAQVGTVKNIKTFFVMSPNTVLQIVSGTSQVEYPNGSGNWVTISNPTINGSTYCWNISGDAALAATLGTTGLQGVGSFPNNRFNLRFRAVSVPCNMKSGVTFLFTTEGTKPCGSKIYATDQITQPITIPGAPTPYNEYDVFLTNNDAAPCNNQTATVRFSAKNKGPLMSAAGEFIDFIVYNGATVIGSITGIHNAPSAAPTILNAPGGTIYRFATPTGVVIGDSVVFTLPVQVNANLSCDTSKVRIEANTNIGFSATCSTNSGVTCTIGQITGQDNDNFINVSRTDLSLSGLTAYTTLNPPSGEILHASVLVTNAGTTTITTANPITVQFYKDADLNGTVSSGDILLGTSVQTVNLTAGQSTTANFTQTVSAGNACPLLVTVQETPCFCNTPVLSTTNVPVKPDSITLTTCPGIATAPIGSNPITGYTYDWVAVTPGANAYLTATNISNPVFSKPTNTSGSIEYITYNLYINRGVGCAGMQTVVVAVDIPANCPVNVGSVGNFVWKDTNGNGLNDEPTSNGLNGIAVELWDATTNSLVSSTTTANNGSGNPGYYNFVINTSGSYYVKFPTTTSSYILTSQTTTAATDGNSDANKVTGKSPTFTINVNGSGVAKDNPTIDAGFTCPNGCIPIKATKH